MRKRPVVLCAAVLAIGCTGPNASDHSSLIRRGPWAIDSARIASAVTLGSATPRNESAALDWENAFGHRIVCLDSVRRFLAARVAPGMRTAHDTTLRVTVVHLAPDVAVADEYWKLVGQTDSTGTVLADRVGRTTYVFVHDTAWRVVLQRVADIRR